MITVFTATYNRAYILPQLYHSLQQQTDCNFEWLIIDDGSRDNTAALVQTWQRETSAFPVVYVKQPNGGKHRAINAGLAQARGEWFFIVDSDDWLPVDAIQKISETTKNLPKDHSFAGVCGFKADKSGRPLGNSLSLKQMTDASMIEIRQKYHIKGDMAEVFKTDILRQFPFPEFEGETFLNEAVVWNKIAQKHILRYVPEVFYFCEYREDGLTKSIRKRYRNSPYGTMCLYDSVFKNAHFCLKEKIRCAILYWRYLWDRKTAYQTAPKWIFLFWPVGLLLSIWDLLWESI